MPSPPPAPILATWSNPDAFITFSTPLTPGVLDHTNWFVRVGDFARGPGSAVMVPPNVVKVTTIGFAPDPGPNVVGYSPPPFDVIGPGGPAAAFADFPIT